jgi:hypothetical protein
MKRFFSIFYGRVHQFVMTAFYDRCDDIFAVDSLWYPFLPRLSESFRLLSVALVVAFITSPSDELTQHSV